MCAHMHFILKKYILQIANALWPFKYLSQLYLLPRFPNIDKATNKMQ